MDSAYAIVPISPPLEVFEIGPAVKKDPNPNKVDLCVAGSYVNEEGKLSTFPVVEKVEKTITNEDKAYLPVLGMESCTKASVKLVLGANSPTYKEGRFIAAQTLSGTGALRIAAEFLVKYLQRDTFYTAMPTWENHHRIFLAGGFKTHKEYRYWHAPTKSIDFSGLIEDLKAAPFKSAVIFQTIAQNPTGVDPTEEQWKEIGQVCKDRGLFPVFDSVRQGFVHDLDRDAWVVRYFTDTLGLELVVCQSFAKNLTLYNERIGNVFFTLKDVKYGEAVKSQITQIIRGNYSNPPAHGARIVSAILNYPDNYQQLEENLSVAQGRVMEMRTKLYEKLKKLGHNWEHALTQRGIFIYSGLTSEQVDILRTTYGLYFFRSCHINVCALNEKNLDYVAQAIAKVLSNYSTFPNAC